MRAFSRREIIALFSSAGAAAIVAACSSGNSNTETPVATATGTSTTPSPAPSGTAIGTATGASPPRIVAAASAFLATLSSDQKSTVQFDWSNTAQKQKWSNLPAGAFQRAGLVWGNLIDQQRNAWLDVMKATLSANGYGRVVAEWNADQALASQGGVGGLQFGTNNYFIALIGQPSETQPWQWQWGGHHVTVNATIAGSHLALTPSFIGVQPATYTDSTGKTVTPLADISADAFALLTSLDAAQQGTAVRGTRAIDLVLGPGQDGKVVPPEGLQGSQMNTQQQAALLKLIGHYGGLSNDQDAAQRMADIQANLVNTFFAWFGPTNQAGSAYFRVTGPTVVIEYSPQQMGGNAADHVHGIYRDPTNDYGAKYT